MPNPVQVLHVEERWRSLDAEEQHRVNAWLGDAWWMLVARRPSLPTDIVGNEALTRNVIRVVSEAVIRFAKNPDAWERETTGPFSHTRHVDATRSGLYISDEDFASLGSGKRGAFTITPTEPETTNEVLLQVAMFQSSWGNK